MGERPKPFYSTMDVSRFCGVHVSTVIRWVDEGRLPSARTPGGVRRIAPGELAAFLKRHGYPIPPELPQHSEPTKAREEDRKPEYGGQDFLVRQILDQLPIGVAQLDKAGTILFQNKKLVEILSGCLAEESQMLGELITEIPNVVAVGADEVLGGLLKEGTPVRNAFFRYESTYGRKVNVSVNGTPLHDADGRINGALVFVEDVGMALELEREADRAREFMKTVVETANVAIFGFDSDDRIILFNRKAQEVTGYSLDEAQQPDFLSKILLDSPAVLKAKQVIARHFEGEVFEDAQWKIRTKGGEERILSISTSLVHAVDGSAQLAIATATDITDREQLRHQIQESNDFLSSVIDNSPFSLQIVHREGWTVKVNKAFVRLLGVSESDIVGEGTHNFFSDKRLIAAGIVGAVRKAFQGEITSMPLVELEGDDVRAPGTGEAVVSVVAFPIVQRGRIQSVGVVYEDITEKASLQQELMAKNTELEAFVYTIAHDLKSPLGVISACGQILSETTEGDEEKKQTAMILRNAERMREFISGILSLSRAGRWDAEQTYNTPASTIVKGLFQDLQAQFPDQEMRLNVEDLPSINLHHDAATQLFQNLIVNAHKYRHPDRVPEISASCESVGGAYRFAVSDNGVGIRPEERKKIFNVFYRGSDTDRAGSGVGLAIAGRVVQRAGGKIWVKSRPGEGSTFYFTIPRTVSQ